MKRWYVASVGVVMVDQCSKGCAEHLLVLHEPVPLLPVLGWLLTYNTGAAFSILGDAGGWQRWFFLGFGLLVSGFLVVWLRKLPSDAHFLAAALTLILGGAIGNLIDRALWGHVIDFIHVYYEAWHFPTFNVADAAISVGAALLIFDSFRQSAPSQVSP